MDIEKEACKEYDLVYYHKKDKVEIKVDRKIPEKKYIDGVCVNMEEINDATRARDNDRQKFISAVFRYVICYKMQTTPEDAIEHMTPELLKEYKLDNLIQKLDIPTYISENNLAYVIAYALDGEKKAREYLNEKKTAQLVYDNLNSGSLRRVPKNLFDTTTDVGRRITGYIMRIFIMETMMEVHTAKSPEDRGRLLYEYFAKNESEILHKLKDKHLESICKTAYINIIDALQAALDENEQNDIMYLNAQYELVRRTILEQRKQLKQQQEREARKSGKA